MIRQGAAGVVWGLIACAIAFGCAPPPDQPDYDEPDAGPHPDAPLVLSVTPEDGSENVDRQPIFRLRFDRHINAQTLSASRFKLSSGDGKYSHYSVNTIYDPTKKEVIAWPGGFLLPECTWVFAIRQGILGVNGAHVTPGVQTTFRTGKEAVTKTPYTVRSFQDEIVPIFEANCSTCHGGAGKGIAGLKLDSKENILETVISVSAVGRSEWKRVAPTRPGESYLLYKLTNDDLITGLRMPRTLDGSKSPPALSSEEKSALFDWITTGAHFIDP
jgi:hypothetical protein